MDVTRVVPRAGFVVAVAMVAALATASAATAQSTVGKDVAGTGIVYTDPGSNTDRIALDWLDNTSTDTFEHAIVSVAGTAPVSAGTGCGGGPATFFCGATMLSLTAALGGGDDALDLRNASDKGHALPRGDHRRLGGRHGPGRHGGGGLRRRHGRRPVHRRALARRRLPRPGRDDTLDLSERSSGFTITLDGVPDDGPGSGGSANVGLDVERVFGGSGTDDITGGIGAETLHGGAGADILEGGAGADQLVGAEGGDTLLARDDFVDGVTCGAGDDPCSPTGTTSWPPTARPSRARRATTTGTARRAAWTATTPNAAVKPGGGDVPGNGLDEDCDGGDAIVDADGDGAGAAVDCDDADRARFPGATEVPENGVDENCDGRDGAFPSVAATVASGWKVFARYTKLTSLKVKGAPAGAKVRVTCKGGKKKGCPFKRKSATAGAKGAVSLTRRFKGARLKPGARRRGPGLRPRRGRQGAPDQDPRQEGAEADDAVPAAGGEEAGRLRLRTSTASGPAWLYSGPAMRL